MSDNEYERFEISDYDLANEFNINRRGRRATKNQQIYGVFAEDNSDDDDTPAGGHAGARGRQRGGRNAPPKDYTAHVPFVAGGIQGKKLEDKPDGNASAASNDDDDDADSDNAPADDSTNKTAANADTAAKSRRLNSSSESEDDAQPAHRGFGTAHMAGFRQSNAAQSSTVTGAKWDQHTKGIGAKLLLKMGYQPGRGLGKDLQGIAQPVQAHLRKGRGAIGAYGAEKGQTIGDGGRTGAAAAKPKVDEDVREQQEFQQKMHQWRKPTDAARSSAASGRSAAAPRYSYKSVQDVIDKGKQKNYILSDRMSAKLSNVTVIDMTGPEKRVLSGYHALGQTRSAGDEILYEHRAAKRCDNFSLPELQHNLQLIVDLCEQDIIAIDKSQRSTTDQLASMQLEQQELRKIATLERSHIETLDGALQLVDRLVEPDSGGGGELTLALAAQIFGELQTKFAAEYREFALADLAPGVVGPLIAMELGEWSPLEEPAKPTALLREWRAILEVHTDGSTATTTTTGGAQHHFDPYSALVWASVIPHVRRACADGWDPRAYAPMARLLDAWSTVLPAWQLDNVLEQMVLPRIVRAVDAWDPLTDTVPVHQWILPWQQLLGDARLEEAVYQKIRVKLAAALVAWRPEDRSARAMLAPWRGVFAAQPMEMFMVKHIVPKLQQSLAELVMNPMQQNLELWHQVAEWQSIIPVPLMCSLLERHFFPKWLQTLVIWLNQSPNLDQVSRWYSGWKAQLIDAILETPTIKEQFNRALGLMQRTLGGISMEHPDGHAPPPATATMVPPPPMPMQQPAMMMMDMQLVAPPPPQLDFRELVSQKCAERGIMFVPMPGRREQGKQVYRVGKLFCYIERAVIMLSDGSLANWAPVSLQAMLDRACSGSI